jgi:hypothetical protein
MAVNPPAATKRMRLRTPLIGIPNLPRILRNDSRHVKVPGSHKMKAADVKEDDRGF